MTTFVKDVTPVFALALPMPLLFKAELLPYLNKIVSCVVTALEYAHREQKYYIPISPW
jgi:hypothetical protein